MDENWRHGQLSRKPTRVDLYTLPATERMTTLDHQNLIPRLRALQVQIRTALIKEMQTQSVEALSRAARDDEGDTIFGIDVEVEEMLLRYCEEWG
jgi:hypothetical protein